MSIEYIFVSLMILVAVGIAAVILFLSHILGPRKFNPVKLSVYESGVKPFSDSRLRFDIKFYIIIILFVLFDIEVVFLYPWAVVYKQMLHLGNSILIEMLVFMGILLAGYVYLWKKGALEWE